MGALLDLDSYRKRMITALDTADLAGSLIASARASGIVYEMHTDFSEINRICESMGKPYNTHLIDPLFHDFTKANCFWLLARFEGDPIACIGLRLDNFAKGEFVKFLDRQYSRVYFSKGCGAIDTTYCPPPFHEIEGPTVYVGDLFVKQEYRGRDNAFRLGEMILLAQTLSYSEWEFRWLYAFIRDRDAFGGKPALYHSALQYPSAVRWIEEPSLRANDDWFVCSRKNDFEFLITVQVQKIRR